MIDSSRKTRELERERIKQEREERTESREPEIEYVEPLTFSTLANELGRQGNKQSSWNCPIGASTR